MPVPAATDELTDEPIFEKPMTAVERMQLSRQRRRDGLRMVSIEIRDTEVEALIRRGFLHPDDKQNSRAIGSSVQELLDEMPPAMWPSVRRR